MLPSALEDPLAAYVRTLDKVAPGQVAALYLVGGAALGDFSARLSNVDLVVVGAPALEERQVAELRRAEGRLERVGRPAAVWYTDWDTIADGTPADGTPADGTPADGTPADGTRPGAPVPELETPLTRHLLAEEAVAVIGPDWPVVAYEADDFRKWCRDRLTAMVGDDHGLMLMRRGVTPLVLDAARAAEGAATGKVLSKSEAGNKALELVPNHYRRILSDAVGYRNGANTSMYWGPFERKTDARQLIRHLADAVLT